MNYFVRNRDTGRLELHLSRTAWNALSEMARENLMLNFCARSYPRIWESQEKVSEEVAVQLARELCLTDRGSIGGEDGLAYDSDNIHVGDLVQVERVWKKVIAVQERHCKTQDFATVRYSQIEDHRPGSMFEEGASA